MAEKEIQESKKDLEKEVIKLMNMNKKLENIAVIDS